MYMKERFGAWQVGGDPDRGAAEFKLFFPDRAKDPTQFEENSHIPDYGDPKIASIQVAGDFQEHLAQERWDFENGSEMTREAHAKGWVWTYRTEAALPAGFYQYKYFVTFEDGTKRIVGDPCTRYGGSENQNSGFVIGGSSPADNEVQPLEGGRKHLRDLVIFEANLDDFTDEFRAGRAPLDAVADKLDYLQDLGVNAILFMPWTAWPGEGFSWGYTPYQYFSVEYRYANAIGRPTEKISWLKQLISKCHERGIHVVMDGVFNHVGDEAPDSDVANGFPYRWLYQEPAACPYVGKFGGEFTGLLDLNYHNGCTREFIRDVCLYWIDHFKIDGIRFDNTTNFYIHGVHHGLPMLLDQIQAHVLAQGQVNFSMTLEHLNLDAANVTNQTTATSYWNDALYQRCFDYLLHWRIDPYILHALDTHTGLHADKVATTYISNHDHSHVAWQAGARDNAGGLQWYRTQPYAIALLTSPGAPMIHNGQEFAEDYWIMENDRGTGRRVRPRPLRWTFAHDGIGAPLLQLYKRLIALRKTHPGLRSNNFYPTRWATWQTRFNPEGYGVDVAKQVVIYHRWGSAEDGSLERFIIVLNFSDGPQYVDIPFSTNGAWRDLLNDRTDDVHNWRLLNQRIESNWGRIYYQAE
jgi:1,4-alpha-glucan branching enzyme